jgi:hypothetical protein
MWRSIVLSLPFQLVFPVKRFCEYLSVGLISLSNIHFVMKKVAIVSNICALVTPSHFILFLTKKLGDTIDI